MSGSIFYIGLFLLVYISFSIGLYKLFEKAGEAGWKALVPVYNWWVWLKLINKPSWWIVLTLIPIVNVLVIVAMVIDLARAYGKHKLYQQAGALLLPFIFFPKNGFDPNVKYLGPPDEQENLPKKSGAREWGDAILFAGVAALIIRTFFIEAFMIPTSSMERTLLAGDFLFVSKFHYGARMPRVPLAIPFVHNKIKVGDVTIPSYTDIITLPYYRTPGLTKVQRNDIVVFNYPAQDQEMWKLKDGLGTVKTSSMKENYIKRCVGMPGDELEIKAGVLYINKEKAYEPPNLQKEFQVKIKAGMTFASSEKGKRFRDESGELIQLIEWSFPKMNELGFRKLVLPAKREHWERYGLQFSPNYNWALFDTQGGVYTLFMTDSIADVIRSMDMVAKVVETTEEKGSWKNVSSARPPYPQKFNSNGRTAKYNVDFFGPIVIPQKGMTVNLNNPKNLSLYWRVISAYEGKDIVAKKDGIRINGEKVDSYTFEMDYYWMMGDNRHNSEDSRFWGFVPEDHIVGKPLFVFMSMESDFGIRFNRIGTKYVK